MSDETDYSSLPLEERLVHKVWKVRLGAYEEITKQFEDSRNSDDVCFQSFNQSPQDFKKVVTDANVVAQETGIQALLKFLELGGTPSNVARLKNAGVVSSLCEKGLSSNRVGTKEKSIQCILMFVEISNEVDGIIEDILSFLGHRLPKLVAGCVNALAQVVANFGCQIVPAKLIIPRLAKLFAHADKNVRAETQKLTVELYKWMRDSLVTILFPELKPVQQKDLTKAFEEVESETPTQLRNTRKQQEEIERKKREEEERAAAAASAGEDVEMTDANSGNADQADQAPEFNPYDLIEPVDVLSKLPSDFQSRIASAKWKDRKEVLDEVHAVLEKAVKLQPKDDYSEIVKIFNKCMKDANIQVVQIAANCTEFLAKGLQSSFQRYQHIILAPMLERTKEKKPSVADALNNCLDAIFKSSSLSDILEETLNGMKHKTPQVKIATTNYLQRCLAETKKAPKSGEIDSIMEIGVKLLTDSQEPVRQASTEMIGTLMKITGTRELNSFLDKIDDNRKAKVMSFYETVTVKAVKAAPAPAAPSAGGRTGNGPAGPAKRTTAPTANKPTRAAPSAAGTTSSTIGAGAKKLTLPSAVSTSGLKKPRSSLNSIPAKRTATSPAKRIDTNLPRSTLSRTGLGTMNHIPPSSSSLKAGSTGAEGLSSADRDELTLLRQQAQQWKTQESHYKQELQQRSSEDHQRFEAELSNLQRKNDSLMKDYNNSLITIKQKETQILRLTSDLESSKLKIRDLEQSMELLKLHNKSQNQNDDLQAAQENQEQDLVNELDEQNRQQSIQMSSRLLFNNRNGGHNNRYSTSFLNDYPTTRITSGELSSRVKRLSIDPEFRESSTGDNNRFSSPHRLTENTNTFGTSNRDGTSMDINSNDDSWKRAAEVTNQLKARIEKMKARSRVNFS